MFPDACAVLTRPFEDNGNLRELLEQDGFEVIENPLIEMVATEVQGTREALQHVRDYDAVIVTSGSVFRALNRSGQTSQGNANVTCYVVGHRTAECARRFGWTAVFPEGAHRAVDLFQYIRSHGVSKTAERESSGRADRTRGRFLWLKGQLADDQPAETLRKAGFVVDEVVCYETKTLAMQASSLLRLLNSGCPVIPFYSPSAVRAFLASDVVLQHQSEIRRIACFAIGATTAEAIRQSELFLAGTAQMATDACVRETVLEFMRRSTT